MATRDRLRLILIAGGVAAFLGLVAELMGGGAESSGKGGAARSTGADARSRGAEAEEVGDTKLGEGPRVRETADRAAQRRALYAAGEAPRLGHRLAGAREGHFDEPEPASTTVPRIIVPSAGEGAESDGWDGLSVAGRIERATREVEAALAQVERASSEEEREHLRARASQALGAARADFYGSNDEAGYAALEAKIEG